MNMSKEGARHQIRSGGLSARLHRMAVAACRRGSSCRRRGSDRCSSFKNCSGDKAELTRAPGREGEVEEK